MAAFLLKNFIVFLYYTKEKRLCQPGRETKAENILDESAKV